MKKQLLLVLPGPPLPLDQGYRHAAYNDIIQLSRFRDLHVLILGEYVYDFHPDRYELNRRELLTIPGVRNVTFVTIRPDWNKPWWQRLLHQISAFLRKGRLGEESGTDNLTGTIVDLCRRHRCSEIHFGYTFNLFVDVFSDLRKIGDYEMSFTAHDVEAEETLIRMRKNVMEKKYLKSIFTWIEYRIRLWKEIRACRLSRFVISIAHKDFVEMERQRVNVFFIPPYLHAVAANHGAKNLPRNSTLAVLGHLAFSAVGRGVDLFLEKVVPRIREGAPQAEIRIIGRDASPEVVSACSRLGVRHQEYVEDLEDLWKEISVLASPLLVAKGIRIRILEAAYRGVPVVSTEESATGFEKPDEFLSVAPDFDAFADSCVELLTDSSAYERQQQRIHSYFERRLSQEVISMRWESVFRQHDGKREGKASDLSFGSPVVQERDSFETG